MVDRRENEASSDQMKADGREIDRASSPFRAGFQKILPIKPVHKKPPFPEVPFNHRWHALIVVAKAKMGFEKWPHDCLLHSYCSYYLAAHENAAKTALQAGHTELILFRHYRKLVKKEQAKKFWAVYPKDTGIKLQVVAA